MIENIDFNPTPEQERIFAEMWAQSGGQIKAESPRQQRMIDNAQTLAYAAFLQGWAEGAASVCKGPAAKEETREANDISDGLADDEGPFHPY